MSKTEQIIIATGFVIIACAFIIAGILISTSRADATVIIWSQSGTYYEPMVIGVDMSPAVSGYVTRLEH